jgi:hypothetical protein
VRRSRKIVICGGPELSSQVLEGGIHLYKGWALSGLEQSGGEGGPSLYDQAQELPALRK